MAKIDGVPKAPNVGAAPSTGVILNARGDIAAQGQAHRRFVLPASHSVCYADNVKSSVSIALFFLLSGFFLAVLLSALERSRKLLAVAGACLAAIVMIIVFLTPVELPSWHLGKRDSGEPVASSVTATTVTAKSGLASSPTSSVSSSSTSLGQARSSVTTIKVTTSIGGSSAVY